MNRLFLGCLKSVLLLFSIALSAFAEDIDIFVGSDGGPGPLPNVIFVLDNTSNWSRQAQKWPGGFTQGQSEVRAIRSSVAGLVGKANVALIEFTTQGNANEDGGYVRFNLQELTDSSLASLNSKLTAIEVGIEDPTEKRNSNTPYGDLMYDVYNYLAGRQQSDGGAGTPSLADSSAYATNYSTFKSPLTTDNLCVNTYLIFIGNPDQSGPVLDSSENTAALTALYAEVGSSPDGLAGTSTPAPLAIPGFSVTTVTDPVVNLGFSAQCYKANQSSDIASCTVAESSGSGWCVGKADCQCSTSQTQSCGKGSAGDKLLVTQGGSTSTVVTPNGSSNTSAGRDWNFDDWAKFLHNYGVPVAGTGSDEQLPPRVKITTYTIDVFNKQQNAQQTGLMLSASEGVGGGRYFAAKSEGEIVSAIDSALSDILSVSSTFAAVTLPLSATNRAQQENQVFIGMFRPYGDPRWYGNLKRYQIALFNGVPELADVNRLQAINPLTGFAAECAASYWTSDSRDYWEDLGVTPAPLGQCLGSTTSAWSDLPDGPFVEKGGVAQVTRQSDLGERAILTVGSSGLTPMTSADALGDAHRLEYLYGREQGQGENPDDQGVRPSLHGDVIHSRPLTINYGDDNGIYAFYGANDGLFRSVRAEDGVEQWSFIAPEHYSKIERLYNNEPPIAFGEAEAGESPKDYFFDGSIGQLVRYNQQSAVDLAYIFPTMRRGGRMVYGFNVTNPTNPALLWRVGCTSSEPASCSNGFSDLGQTWSTPVSGYLGGYTVIGVMQPIIMFGGGYDSCLDATQAALDCSDLNVKGKGIYVLDAANGTLIAGPEQLTTDAPVVADLASVDMNFDGVIDFAYAADAAGGLYRINFSTLDSTGALTTLSPALWRTVKVANTLNNTRRFLNQPSVAVVKNSVYVGIGSGNRERPLKTDYPFVQDVQDRFYVFVDQPAEASDSPVDLDGSLIGDVTSSDQCNGKGQRGWLLDLAGRGEQIVNPATIAGGQIFFNSYRPGGTSENGCSRPLGIATGYRVNLFNPRSCDVERTTDIAGGGMPIPPIITTVPVTDEKGNEQTVTVCIGCEGLDPIPIEPETDQTRRRIFWNSDVDR
ncbi:pilus assembly protein [Metapseudomonas boanensis]|uniref:PilY1 beta-propeller domain-containing protein n=1 Tax=Metapseudomonas boanensis TaxID=2822138 RepID=A0ABS5XMQ6_9GAMM|nr:PilC/PilY family type IV pilus protein [Pseudomonas boanensis]MBT8768994.1 hypothetical protein [Pseudomonas boanensis]